MQSNSMPLTAFYEGWPQYQRLLVEAVTPLSVEQLTLRAAPSLRPVWLLAAHIIGARVRWFHRLLGEDAPAFLTGDAWDRDGARSRSAAELVEGLAGSWQLLWSSLERWTPAMLGDVFTRPPYPERTRGWVIWHVVEHDLHHGGELSLTLGMHGLPAPDL